jgi:hypothetical protein
MNKNKTKQNKKNDDDYQARRGRGSLRSSTSSGCRLTHARSEALVSLYILIQPSNETKKSTADRSPQATGTGAASEVRLHPSVVK